jgi:hypothetical protein
MGKMTYLKNRAANADASTVVQSIDVSVNDKIALGAIGETRFNTFFVRKLFFITNVVRVVRLKLNRELTQSRGVLVSSHSAVAAGLTEYGTDRRRI